MTRTILIVPGLHGSGEGHWQAHWLADQPNAKLVQQADWSNPNAEAWLRALEAAVRADPHCILVAHSLGSILTARLAQSPVRHLVDAALLVAPADIERTGELHGRSYEFGVTPRALLPFPSIAVVSRNDPYMPHEKVVVLARSWGSAVHELGRAGHVNVESGYGRWIAGYALADKLSGLTEQNDRKDAFALRQ